MKTLFLTLILILYLVSPTNAQVACGPSDVVDYQLSFYEGKQPVGRGIVNGNVVYMLYLAENGDFTIVRVSTDGSSCRMAQGSDWDFSLPTDMPEGPKT